MIISLLFFNRKFRLREHKMRVFENKVLKREFDPKTDEVTGKWRRLRGAYDL
jgi:hypothetical protein